MRKKRTPELLPKLVASDKEFRRDMRFLLDDDEHCDATFVLQNGDTTKIRAHKCILTARSDYFRALFRHDTFRESRGHGIVTVEADFTAEHVRSVLHYIYYNRVPRLERGGTEELLAFVRSMVVAPTETPCRTRTGTTSRRGRHGRATGAGVR